MPHTAKLFRNGRSQAVRLPVDFRFPGSEVYVRREAFPDRNNYDAFLSMAPPGDCLSIGPNDSPPLSQGLYVIGVYNPNSFPVTVRITVRGRTYPTVGMLNARLTRGGSFLGLSSRAGKGRSRAG